MYVLSNHVLPATTAPLQDPCSLTGSWTVAPVNRTEYVCL